jgi:DNA modification methylase
MNKLVNINSMDFSSIPDDTFWSVGTEKEDKMHRIHAYPAKFPAFITTKALNFAKKKKLKISRIADVFCGCGTVAYESKRNGIPFWGCDINPVATLVAKTKSYNYQQKYLNNYYQNIIQSFNIMSRDNSDHEVNERLIYWYDSKHYKDLSVLKKAIENNIPKHSNYRLFFLCAFSNILKPTSRWLTKSIKPQIDPNKKPADVIKTFEAQCRFMMSANSESNIKNNIPTDIVTGNFLDNKLTLPEVDMIITSPPYVTSYEYADLHQLSTLWLWYTADYREFREGSIGSLYHVYDFNEELKGLNTIGQIIIAELIDKHKSKAHSVAKYFLDMQAVANKCYKMIVPGGLALFVIGNTEYKGVIINNVKHLAESLQNSGFRKLYVTKRRIRQKILTPYRNSLGRFSSDSSSRKVYSEEFILIGMK